MTVIRVLLYLPSCLSTTFQIGARDKEDTSFRYEIALAYIVNILILEAACYANYKRETQLYLQSWRSQQQDKLLKGVLNALPGSILVCSKAKAG